MGSKGTMKSFWIGKVYHVTGYVVGFERKCLSIDTVGTKECAVLRKLHYHKKGRCNGYVSLMRPPVNKQS